MNTLFPFVITHQRPPSFFDIENQLDKIYQLNDSLPKLNALIDWEIFRQDLNKVREKERLSNAGRKPFDVILMFKILILKARAHQAKTKEELKELTHNKLQKMADNPSLLRGIYFRCCVAVFLR